MFRSLLRNVCIVSGLLFSFSASAAGWGFVSIIIREGNENFARELQKIEMSFVPQQDLDLLDAIMTYLVMKFGEDGKSYSYMIDKTRNVVHLFKPSQKQAVCSTTTVTFSELIEYNKNVKEWLRAHKSSVFR